MPLERLGRGACFRAGRHRFLSALPVKVHAARHRKRANELTNAFPSNHRAHKPALRWGDAELVYDQMSFVRFLEGVHEECPLDLPVSHHSAVSDQISSLHDHPGYMHPVTNKRFAASFDHSDFIFHLVAVAL